MTAPETWYHATAPRRPRPRVDGAVRTDVCIIGGGLAGVSTALHCAERGLDAVLIEAGTLGCGASGRNGGQIVQGFSADMSTAERAVGSTAAHDLWSMGREAIEDVRDRVARHAIDADLRFGYLHAALNHRQMSGLEETAETWARYGYTRPTLLDRQALGDWLGSQRYVGGLADPESGQIHPLRYLLGLADAAESAGARLYESSAAIRIDGTTVTTEDGSVTADRLVFCGNAYLGRLQPRLWTRIMPVASFVAVTEPLDRAVADRLFPRDVAVADCNTALDYFRLTGGPGDGDRRLLFGAEASYSARTPAGLEGRMRARIARVFPELGTVGIDHLWGGLIGITINRLPDIGRQAPERFHAQGFSGQGVALTGLAGKLIAEALTGDDGRLVLFERIRHLPFPGGPLRMPTLVAAMAWAKGRDWLGL